MIVNNYTDLDVKKGSTTILWSLLIARAILLKTVATDYKSGQFCYISDWHNYRLDVDL